MWTIDLTKDSRQILLNIIKTLRIVSSRLCAIYKSSRLEMSCKKVVLKSFARFAGKHLRLSLFFVSFAKFLRTLFYITLPVAASVFILYTFSTLISYFFCSLSSNSLLGVTLFLLKSLCQLSIFQTHQEIK